MTGRKPVAGVLCVSCGPTRAGLPAGHTNGGTFSAGASVGARQRGLFACRRTRARIQRRGRGTLTGEAFDAFDTTLQELIGAIQAPPPGFTDVAKQLEAAALIARRLRKVRQGDRANPFPDHMEDWPDLFTLAASGRRTVERAIRTQPRAILTLFLIDSRTPRSPFRYIMNPPPSQKTP